MYCKNCGNELPENTRFCPSCGVAVEDAYPVIPAGPAGVSGSDNRFEWAQNNDMQTGRSPKKKKPILKKWWFWVIVILALGSIGRIGTGKTSSRKTSSNKPSIVMEDEVILSATATPKPTEKATPTPKPTDPPVEEESDESESVADDEMAAALDVSEPEPEIDEEPEEEESALETVLEPLTLRDGKYIIGEDIAPGDYVITCIENDGETIGDMYSSMGDAYSKMGDDDGLGDLMNSLGGMMGNVITTSVEILGDYGTVLKTVELKTDESASITLTEKTALQITGGKCVLEPKR